MIKRKKPPDKKGSTCRQTKITNERVEYKRRKESIGGMFKVKWKPKYQKREYWDKGE